MKVRIASEASICWSFVGPSEWRLWILIWISSWDPLKVCDGHPPHRLSPARANHPAGQDPKAVSTVASCHSNAPIKPESQSILSKIVAHFPQSFLTPNP
jgi:hypothetical protein